MMPTVSMEKLLEKSLPKMNLLWNAFLLIRVNMLKLMSVNQNKVLKRMSMQSLKKVKLILNGTSIRKPRLKNKKKKDVELL